MTNTRAGIGIGGKISMTRLCGKYIAYASSSPNTPPDAPIVGYKAPVSADVMSWAMPAESTQTK